MPCRSPAPARSQATPVTPRWSTVVRTRLPAGSHTVSVRYRGQARERTIELEPGGWAVVNFSDLR